MKHILWFKTVQCMVRVYDTETDIVGEKVFMVTTHHNKTNKILVRFGTRQQLYSLLKPYQYSTTENKSDYEWFMNRLSSEKALFKL